MNRISKMTVGTIGPRPCEVSLSEILAKTNNAKITNRVLRRYEKFCEGLRLLKPLQATPDFYLTMLRVWHENQFTVLKTQQETSVLPEDAYTHLQCCMKAKYREALKEGQDLYKAKETKR